MAQSPETVGVKTDLTNDVRDFFDTWGSEREAKAVHIPGLHVVKAEDGTDLSVTRHIHSFDGCSPYEYDVTNTAATFAVKALQTHRYAINRGIGRIQLEQGGSLPYSQETIDAYRFVLDGIESSQPTQQEQDLHEYLIRVPLLADSLPGELVRFDQTMHVSAANPFKAPITIVKDGDFRQDEPLYDNEVVMLSVADSPEGRQVSLWVKRDVSGSLQRLSPALLEDVRFSIHDIPHTPEWMGNMIPWLIRNGKLREAEQLRHEFNSVISSKGLPFFVISNDNNTFRPVDVVTARYEHGCFADFDFTPMPIVFNDGNGRIHRIEFEPTTHQPFGINTSTGIAVSLNQVNIRKDHPWVRIDE